MRRHVRSRRVGGALAVALVAAAASGCFALFDFDGYDTSRSSASNEAGSEDPSAGRIVLGPIEPLAMRRGGRAVLPVTIDRRGATGAVRVELSGLPSGVRAAGAVIDPSASSAFVELTSDATAALTTSTIKVRVALVEAPGGVRYDGDEALVSVTVTLEQLDPSYGEGGYLLGSPSEELVDMVLDGQGRPHVLTATKMQVGKKYKLAVDIDTGAGKLTRVTTHESDQAADPVGFLARLAVAPSGDIYVADIIDAKLRATAGDGTLKWSAPLVVPDAPSEGSMGGLAVLPDGKVLVAAAGRAPIGVPHDGGLVSGVDSVFLQRFTPDGAKDTTFGPGGLVLYVDPAFSPLQAKDLATSADGYFVPFETGVSSAYAPQIVRFASDGTTDVRRPAIGVPRCNTLAALSSTLLGGGDSDAGAVLFRLERDGGASPSFGDGGVVTSAPGARAAAVGATANEGRILWAGVVERSGASSAIVSAHRPDGLPDPAFGNAGSYELGIGDDSVARILAVRADDRIFVAGDTTISGARRWFIARLLP